MAEISGSRPTGPPDGARAADSEQPERTLPDSDPASVRFTPEVLDKTVIAVPLLKTMKAEVDAAAAVATT